jgi:hypothetical protein
MVDSVLVLNFLPSCRSSVQDGWQGGSSQCRAGSEKAQARCVSLLGGGVGAVLSLLCAGRPPKTDGKAEAANVEPAPKKRGLGASLCLMVGLMVVLSLLLCAGRLSKTEVATAASTTPQVHRSPPAPCCDDAHCPIRLALEWGLKMSQRTETATTFRRRPCLGVRSLSRADRVQRSNR